MNKIDSEPRESGMGLKFIAYLVCTALIAFALRAYPWKNFLGSEGELLFYGPDSYDHLRRITLGLAQFPGIPLFDSYYGYPVGTGFIWSPFFDYFLTFATLVSGGTTDAAQLIGFWISPVLGGITAVVIYFPTTRLFGRLAGAVAAFVIALLPGHILYTFVSELDHHSVEPLLALAVLMSVAALQNDIGTIRLKITPWFRSALCFVAVVLLWRGAVIFWVMAIGGVILQVFALRAADKQAATRLGVQGACLCVSAALLLVPVCLVFGGISGSGMKFNVVSWFHVVLLTCCALLFFLLSYFDFHSKRAMKLTAIVLVLVCALFLTFGQKFLREIVGGLVVVGRGDPWLDSISELRSMLFPSGKFTLLHSLETLSLAYWLLPFLLWHLFREWRKSRDLKTAVFLVWAAALWTMPLFRERYVHLAALPVAIGVGCAAKLLSETLAARFGKITAGMGSAFMVLILMAPVASFLVSIPNVTLPKQEIADLPAALRYLREKTPLTSNYMYPVKSPEYGVLSEWSLGAYVCYLGQRPSVATNFGWETHGLFESVSFLTTSDPLFAERILEKNQVRFLLMSNVSENLQNFRKIAEHGASIHRIESLESKFNPLATMYYRLYIQDGAAYTVGDLDLPALGNYRLVYETVNGIYDQMVGPVSYYKIFEKVKGALLQGSTKAGARVSLKLSFRSPAGRILTYRDWTFADQHGVYRFRVPYSTTGRNGDMIPTDPCKVSVEDKIFKIDIGESEVKAGSRVYLNK